MSADLSARWISRASASPVRRLIAILTVAAFALILFSGGAARAAPPGAAMTVTPAEAARGLQIFLSGSGLPAHRRARLILGGRQLGWVRADRRGGWTARPRLPRRTRSGTPSLSVFVGDRRAVGAPLPVRVRESARAATTTLVALADGEQVRLSPDHIRAGWSVALLGNGFPRHSVVGVWLDERRLQALHTGRKRWLLALVRIPATTRRGPHVLTARDRGHQLRLRLVVTPAARRPTPTPRQGPPAAPSSPPTSMPPASASGSSSPSPGGSPPSSGGSPPSSGGSPPSGDPVVDAAGDLACSPNDPNFNGGAGMLGQSLPKSNSCLQRSVSDLVANQMPSAFLTLGDNQYGTSTQTGGQCPGNANGNHTVNGTLNDYQQVYDPTFGRANAVVYPEVGDGDYGDWIDTYGYYHPCVPGDDSGFTSYFTNTGLSSRIQQHGGDATHLSQMYYSFNLGDWHLIALNSQCANLPSGACGAEGTWLKADLAAHLNMCTLAYWHVPAFGNAGLSGGIGGQFFSDLYSAGADIVLNAHDANHYERLAPQNPSGQYDPHGIREFIVSSGGYSHGEPPAGGPAPNSAVSDYTTMGILQLTLHPTSYDWRFLPGADGTFTDSGSASCNSAH